MQIDAAVSRRKKFTPGLFRRKDEYISIGRRFAQGYHIGLRTIDRILFAGGAIFLAAWFFRLAGDGLYAWFSGDDLMNLYGAWSTPVWRLAAGCVIFSDATFRPLGALWYRTVFALAGFDPLAFHAAAFVILFANIALSYVLARQLTGRRETAAVAALLVSYNARFANLYYDTGAIYDVLCYFFYYAALVWYVRLRRRGLFPGTRHLAVFALLAVCALDAKEMAVTLPLVVLSFELVFHRPQSRSLRALGRWLRQEGRGAVVAGVPAACFALAKAVGPAAIVHAPGYRLTISAERAMSNARVYLDHIFYRYGWFTSGRALALWLGMLALAVASRSRVLAFAWLLLTVTILPMLFLEPRAGSAIYVCLFGWALYAAALASALTDPLMRWLPARIKGAALFLATAALLYPYHRFEGRFTGRSATESGEELRAVSAALDRVRPSFPPGARILFLNDPIRPDVHDLMFLVRLSYQDQTLAVDRVKMMSAPPEPAGWARYDFVYDYAAGRFLEVRHP